MSPAGQRNAITISGGAGGQVVVDDAGAAIVPLPSGCVAASPSRATCSGVLRITADAGDLDDSVRNDTALASTLSGGSGHDTLVGGSANDLLRGGGDLDVLDGREGDDVFDVRGGIADQVTCGPGNDKVIGDVHDTVNVDCETSTAGRRILLRARRLRRRPSPPLRGSSRSWRPRRPEPRRRST